MEIQKQAGRQICASYVTANPIPGEVACACSYPEQSILRPLRLDIHQKSRDPIHHPTFVSVQQDHYITSWTLPIISPTRGQDYNNSRDSRTKTVRLEAYNHTTIASTWYIFCITAFILTVIAIVVTMLICAITKRTLSCLGESSEDEAPLVGESGSRPSCHVEVTRGMFSFGSMRHDQHGRPSHRRNNHYSGEQEADGIQRGADEDSIGQVAFSGRLTLDAPGAVEGVNSHRDVRAVVPFHPPSFLPATTHAPEGESSNISESFNPRCVLWWKTVAVHEAGTGEAQVSEVGFQNSLVIMGVFAALPTGQLLRSYLRMVLDHGQEDQCFWNSRCLTAFGFLPDFARVFTNYGYIVLGISFIIIVKKHKNLTHRILQHFSARDSVGVTHCYGLFVSLGYGLVLQGVMSALYHTCPNSVTIKFGT
ncbi:SID1 transmembrane family member 1 [Portunus trituberculatus]|uniref:SID1 transmembrane family member 1 n=1 Tax=Portunus trituberculatus TaxID=210409 RepID=A0A5B7DRC7_PORTR|nr:SID1 transmembrane family member 1 [Portunus trituberculatus]